MFDALSGDELAIVEVDLTEVVAGGSEELEGGVGEERTVVHREALQPLWPALAPRKSRDPLIRDLVAV